MNQFYKGHLKRRKLICPMGMEAAEESIVTMLPKQNRGALVQIFAHLVTFPRNIYTTSAWCIVACMHVPDVSLSNVNIFITGATASQANELGAFYQLLEQLLVLLAQQYRERENVISAAKGCCPCVQTNKLDDSSGPSNSKGRKVHCMLAGHPLHPQTLLKCPVEASKGARNPRRCKAALQGSSKFH